MLHAATLVNPIPVFVARTRMCGATMMPVTTHAKSTTACSMCCLQGVCLPGDLQAADVERFGDIATTKRRVARGASLSQIAMTSKSKRCCS